MNRFLVDDDDSNAVFENGETDFLGKEISDEVGFEIAAGNYHPVSHVPWDQLQNEAKNSVAGVFPAPPRCLRASSYLLYAITVLLF